MNKKWTIFALKSFFLRPIRRVHTDEYSTTDFNQLEGKEMTEKDVTNMVIAGLLNEIITEVVISGSKIGAIGESNHYFKVSSQEVNHLAFL